MTPSKAQRVRPAASAGGETRARPSGRVIAGSTAATAPTGDSSLPASALPPVVDTDTIALTEQLSAPTVQSPEPAPVANLSRAVRRRWTAGRIMRWGAGTVGLLLLLVAAWGVLTVVQLQYRIYKPLPPTPTAPAAVASVTSAVAISTTAQPQQAVAEASPTPDRLKLLPSGRINVLVLGIDKRPTDQVHYARSDTMLLANVDTISKTVRIMSIPRDLVVTIPGYKGTNKINSAYMFGEYYNEPGGGQALAMRTVSQLFNVPIDYYIAVNFDGFRQVVNAVGGVDINVPYSIDDYNYPSDDIGDLNGTIHVHFDEGWQHMDGMTALRYARTRHADNDFARSRRQLQIIMAVRQKAMSLNLLPAVPNLIDALGGMVETNIPFDQQLAFVQLGYNIQASNVMTMSIDSTMITPSTLPDGSEGLQLNWKAAQPMIDSFFGWSQDGSASSGMGDVAAQPTANSGFRRNATAVPTGVPAGSKR